MDRDSGSSYFVLETLTPELEQDRFGESGKKTWDFKSNDGTL